ncbi:hypothetical protein M2G37_21790 [Vibrio vulnificus]|nr:hypothetical protein [Vibrio vulnificus]
MAFLLCVAFGV